MADEKNTTQKPPKESIEKGTSASTYADNPDKPDPTSVAQIEKLPDES